MKRLNRIFVLCGLLVLIISSLAGTPACSKIDPQPTADHPDTSAKAPLVKVCSKISCEWIEYASLNLIDIQDNSIQSNRMGEILIEVTRAVNMPPNFKLSRRKGINNALAKVVHHPDGVIRVIEYDPDLFEQWKEIAEKSVELVIAHEVGHHVSGHTFFDAGNSKAMNHRKELEADYFAGGVLARLGVSRAQTSQALDVLGPDESFSHPGRERRRAEVLEGWDNATPSQAGGGRTQPRNAPSASMQNVRTEYDVYEGTQKGMRIHIDFTVYNLKEKEIEVAAYFYEPGGDALKDLDGSYRDPSGNVGVGNLAKPSYDGSRWRDFTLFMPYDQLHRQPGSGVNQLKFNVLVWDHSDADARLLKKSNWTRFEYTPPEPGKASIQNVWLDHNVHEGNQKGMRIHVDFTVDFTVDNFKGKEIEVAAYFYYQEPGGDALEDFDDSYRDPSGNVAVSDRTKPRYASSRWRDFKIFMPYDQLHLHPSGRHELVANVLIWEVSGATPVQLAWSEGKRFSISYPE